MNPCANVKTPSGLTVTAVEEFTNSLFNAIVPPVDKPVF